MTSDTQDEFIVENVEALRSAIEAFKGWGDYIGINQRHYFMAKAIRAYLDALPAQLDAAVAWIVERPTDQTFPRFFETRGAAEALVGAVTVNPPPIARPPVYAAEKIDAKDTFNGDNAALIQSATALLALDARNALVPHGIGGLARELLETFIARLTAPVDHPEVVGDVAQWQVWVEDGIGPDGWVNEDAAMIEHWRAKGRKVRPLYAALTSDSPALEAGVAKLWIVKVWNADGTDCDEYAFNHKAEFERFLKEKPASLHVTDIHERSVIGAATALEYAAALSTPAKEDGQNG